MERPAPEPCSWLAVVVDNSIPARPQSGLSEASIVYELPAEGGITRLLALYCESAPQVVGPVRSLRTFMLDIAREYTAVVAHSGQSESALDALKHGAGPVINEFWQPRPFWRDRHRRVPHNLYTSIPTLRGYVRPASTLPPVHWTTAEAELASEPMTISIPYGSGYDARFEYDPASGKYRRFVAQQPAVDAAIGQQITVAAVIVQYARYWQVYEGPILTGRLDLVGQGRISVFTAGRRMDGRWRRDGLQHPTLFTTDANGNRLTLPVGLVWISIVPNNRTIQVRPE